MSGSVLSRPESTLVSDPASLRPSLADGSRALSRPVPLRGEPNQFPSAALSVADTPNIHPQHNGLRCPVAAPEAHSRGK